MILLSRIKYILIKNNLWREANGNINVQGTSQVMKS